MTSHEWDERYSGEGLVWRSAPNQFLVAETLDLRPGRAVGVACGEGRNAIWLAEQGWEVTGLDFSPVGLAKAERLADQRGVDVTWVESAVEDWAPSREGFDLVAVLYLQLPGPARQEALSRAALAVAPGGKLLVVAHDLENLAHGYGGPQDPDVLYQVHEVTDLVIDAGLTVGRADRTVRVVNTDSGRREALDTVVTAWRPARARSSPDPTKRSPPAPG